MLTWKSQEVVLWTILINGEFHNQSSASALDKRVVKKNDLMVSAFVYQCGGGGEQYIAACQHLTAAYC